MESSRFDGHDARCACWLQQRVGWCLGYLVGSRDNNCFAVNHGARLIVVDDLAARDLNDRRNHVDLGPGYDNHSGNDNAGHAGGSG